METRHGVLEGSWLNHSPGRILKYLICARGQASVEELAEALWPSNPHGSFNSVRFQLHVLRSRLEPLRPRGESSYVTLAGDGCLLNPRLVVVDSDLFRWEAGRGLNALSASKPDATAQLEYALSLYRGDLLAGERAPWALEERRRLRELADRSRQALAELRSCA